MVDEVEKRQYLDDITVADLRALLDKHKHLMVAEHLKTRTPRDFYYSFIQSQFQSQNAAPAEVHRLLVDLNPRMIITTNYDRLIEDAFAACKSKAMTVLQYSNSTVVQRRIQEDTSSAAPFLFKIHGDIDDPDGIILSETDYRRLIFSEPGYRTLLASLFIHYTVLFIGFSFSDEELSLTLAELRWFLKSASHPDYILLPDSDCTSVERSRFRDDYGLEVITYPKSENHMAVRDFMLELKACLPKAPM